MNNFLKKAYIYFVLFCCFSFLQFSCEKENKYLDGYYYNPLNSNIYQFNINNMKEYNLKDSTSVNYVIIDNNIETKKGKYKTKKDEDFILIYGFGPNEIDIKLKKFDFQEFDLTDLNDTEWAINITEKERFLKESFLKFQDQRGYHFLIHNNDNLTDTIYAHYFNYKGNYFNKFHIYMGNSISVIGNFQNDELEILNINYFDNYKTDELILTKLPPKNVNDLLIGKWYGVNQNIRSNLNSYYRFAINNKDPSLSFKDKFENIKNKYNKIEFTNEQKFIRYTQNGTVTYEIGNGISSKYIFLKDLDSHYFKIQKLTKDTLKIEISEQELRYTFVRDSIQK